MKRLYNKGTRRWKDERREKYSYVIKKERKWVRRKEKIIEIEGKTGHINEAVRKRNIEDIGDNRDAAVGMWKSTVREICVAFDF